MTTAMQVVVLAFVGFSMVGCGQGDSSAGVVERGVEGTAVSHSQSSSVARGEAKATPRSLALGHTAHPGYIVRWPSRTVSVNISTPWAKKAARMWRKKGFKFRMGKRGGIKFGGYNSTMTAVGRAQFSNCIDQCSKVFRFHIGGYAMAEIEHMASSGPEALEDFIDLVTDDFWRRKQDRGVHIAL